MSYAEGGGAVLIRDPEACGGREMGHCWGKVQGREEGEECVSLRVCQVLLLKQGYSSNQKGQIALPSRSFLVLTMRAWYC